MDVVLDVKMVRANAMIVAHANVIANHARVCSKEISIEMNISTVLFSSFSR